MSDTQQFNVLFGGWYQRTTLHLTEIYDFFKLGKSQPELDQQKLNLLLQNLSFASVSREAEYLEYVRATTHDGITIRYYEDGLYVLELQTDNVAAAKNQLENYYLNSLEPAISYIFSLGAPLPKILANIKVSHPVVVATKVSNPEKLALDENTFGPVYSQISSKGVTVYKTPGYIFIASQPKISTSLKDISEMQIFFREFKDQLSKYLSIHRRIWEEIGEIKERKSIPGSQISPLRARLDSYQKTVNLISNRINQMGTYVHTRATMAKDLEIENHLKTLFEFKFEILTNTLAYIKEIWAMTKEYLSSAISILTELETRSTNNSLRSLQIITSIGVISSVLTYLTKNEWPKITTTGLFYFVLLSLATFLLNYLISRYYKNLQYQIKFTDSSTQL
jgi:hypothetical protein